MVRTPDLFPPDADEPAGEYLTFDILDDLMDVPVEAWSGELARTCVGRIGPLVEYTYHDYENPRGVYSAKLLVHFPPGK